MITVENSIFNAVTAAINAAVPAAVNAAFAPFTNTLYRSMNCQVFIHVSVDFLFVVMRKNLVQYYFMFPQEPSGKITPLLDAFGNLPPSDLNFPLTPEDLSGSSNATIIGILNFYGLVPSAGNRLTRVRQLRQFLGDRRRKLK